MISKTAIFFSVFRKGLSRYPYFLKRRYSLRNEGFVTDALNAEVSSINQGRVFPVKSNRGIELRRETSRTRLFYRIIDSLGGRCEEKHIGCVPKNIDFVPKAISAVLPGLFFRIPFF